MSSSKRMAEGIPTRRGRPKKTKMHSSFMTVDDQGNISQGLSGSQPGLQSTLQPDGDTHHHTITTVHANRIASTRTITSFSAATQITLPNADQAFEEDTVNYECDGRHLDIMEPLVHNIGFMNFESMDKFNEEFNPTTKPRVRAPEMNPMNRWARHDRDIFLEEFIRFEGRGPFIDSDCCSLCHNAVSAEFRCEDCTSFGQLLCQHCVVQSHKHLPFHRIESWTGSYFSRVHLKALGLRIQLGHPRGNLCHNPKRAPNDDFVIIDSTGIHEVGLDFCECQEPGPRRHALQLLRAGLYPATSTNPSTAATFTVLKQFSMFTYESKMSPFAFIKSLERLTSNTSISPVKDRRDEFIAMYQQWRHLKQLKRAGRGHDAGGAMSTKPGECAMQCPACPIPDINLPLGWELDKEKSWLYALFLGIDGNFRLKRKMVSDDTHDPGLNDGWAFVVAEKPYKAHIAKHWDYKQERSTCVDHDAVNQSDKEVRGLAATGATTTDCIRHDFKRPCGVGDFQKGERYINTDYVLFSSLKDTKLETVMISYDISCQHSKNMEQRQLMLPVELQWSSSVKSLTFFIPKFHIRAHIAHCQLNYSFNLTKGVGRTDGEGPERGWAAINPIATSTKEMGPGNRRDTLDDHFNDYNWMKITDFARSMLEKMKKAVPERARHGIALKDFEATLDKVPGQLALWRSRVELWEDDRSKPNPYESETSVTSERDVRLQLAQEAATETANDKHIEDVVDYVISVHTSSEVHPSAMISMGLDLEDLQRKLAIDVKALGLHPTKKQITDMVDRFNRLRRRIAMWAEIQGPYMPEAVAQRDAGITVNVAGIAGVSAPNIPLCLPSSFPSKSTTITRQLCMYEWKLREGQAYDCLDAIRQNLRLYTHIFINQKKYNRGTQQNTRSNDALTKAQGKANHARAKYLEVRTAMLKLAPRLVGEIPETWQKKLQDLKADDIKGLAQVAHGETEGTRQISWIWMAEGAFPEDANSGLHEDLRVEWSRMRARAMRWDEEVLLLSEEMRRILAFYMWKSDWWAQRGKELNVDKGTRDGMDAYAAEQAAMWLQLAMGCTNAWADVPRFKEMYPIE